MRRHFPWLFFVAGFLLTRIYGLEKLPLFSDEAYAIVRAQEILHGAPILGMVKNTTQPIFIWAIALFQLLPLGNIVAGRMVSILAGLITSFILAKAASQYIHPKASMIAFFLVVFLPFTFFYDRTVLFESLTGMFISGALFYPLLSVPLAILTKQTGWLAAPLAIVIHRKRRRFALAILLASFLIPVIVWLIALDGPANVISVVGKKTSVPLGFGVPLKENLFRSIMWLKAYVPLPILLWMFLGTIIEVYRCFQKKLISPLLVVAFWAAGVILFESSVAKIFYPRYLFPLVPAVILLSTKGIWECYTCIKERWIRTSFFASLVFFPVVLVSFSPLFRFDWLIATNPSQAPLALEDHFQFFEDWTSGVGSMQLEQALIQALRDRPEGITVFLEEENSYYVLFRSNRALSKATIEIAPWLIDPLTVIPKSVLQSQVGVYFVRNRYPDIPPEWPIELVIEIPKTDTRSVYLYRILKP